MTCPSGKIPFPSPQAAMRQRPSAHRRSRGNKLGITKVYQCPECRQWHLTRGTEYQSVKKFFDKGR